MTTRQAGFTLIEMVVVLAILAMTALLVLPRLPDTREASLKSSARALATTIRYVRDQALLKRLPHRLRFTAGEGRIAVTTLPPGGTEAPANDPFLARRILADDITVSDVTTPRLGRVASGEISMDIGLRGIAEATIIHLREPGGKEMTVIAFPFGGQVKVQDGYQEFTQ